MCHENKEFSKEILIAIKKLKDNWASRSIKEQEITDVDGMFHTGYYGFSDREVVMNNGQDWRWNQSIANITFNITPTEKVIIRKLNTRRRNPQVGEFPSYKVWIYQIYKEDEEKPYLYFLWCEKGLRPISPETVTLEDLAFLKPFISEELARGFSW